MANLYLFTAKSILQAVFAFFAMHLLEPAHFFIFAQNGLHPADFKR
jgi:hypothetical protein